MTILACLVLLVPLGVLIPRLVVRRLPNGAGVALAVLITLAAGAGVVYAAAPLLGALKGTDPKLEFETGFNAWKLLIFLAPAAAIHFRRKAAAGSQAPASKEDA